MADWARIAATTTPEYVKGEEEEVMRNRKILALVQDRGQVTYNHSGTDHNYKVRYRRAPMTGFTDGDTLSFSRQNRHKTAVAVWRGYTMTDSITLLEREKNKGEPAMVKIWSEMVKLLTEDITDALGDEAYIDGNASGNSKRWHGIESMFGTSGAGTKQPIGKLNSTYNNLICTQGNYGGSWSSTGSTVDGVYGDWPTGTGDAQFDFWSPLVVDYTSAIATSPSAGTIGWAAGTKTWANTCLEATRYGIIHSQKNKSKYGMTDLITQESELFRLFKDKCQAEEQIMITPGDGEGLRKLGFKDVINFDGCDITSEFGIPRYTAYGWCIGCVHIMSLFDVLIKSQGPDYDISSTAWRFLLIVASNMRFEHIRQFCKWKNLT